MLEVILCDNIGEFEKRYKKIKKHGDILCLTKSAELFSSCSKLYENVEVRLLESNKNYLEVKFSVLRERYRSKCSKLVLHQLVEHSQLSG